MHTYQHVLWDWNGTLLDDAWLSIDIINRILHQRHLPQLTPERYQDEFDFPVREYYRKLGFDFSYEPYEVLAAEFMDAFDRRWRECPIRQEATHVLQVLAERGYHHAILSACEQTRLELMLAHHTLQGFFTRVHGISDYYAHGKVDIGLQLLAELGCRPDQVVLIGDTTHDHAVATAMGIECLLIPSGHHAPAKLAACGVPVLTSLEDVLSLLSEPQMDTEMAYGQG